MGNELRPRERIAVFVALVLILGGAVAAVFGVMFVVERYFPALNRPHEPSVGEIVVAFAVVMSALAMGLLVGSALCLVLLRPFLTKDEIREFFGGPDIPGYSDVLRKLMDALNGKAGKN